jgi:hypothetical protein
VEVHPEASFAEIAGTALNSRKTYWTGTALRHQLLADSKRDLDVMPIQAAPHRVVSPYSNPRWLPLCAVSAGPHLHRITCYTYLRGAVSSLG